MTTDAGGGSVRVSVQRVSRDLGECVEKSSREVSSSAAVALAMQEISGFRARLIRGTVDDGIAAVSLESRVGDWSDIATFAGSCAAMKPTVEALLMWHAYLSQWSIHWLYDRFAGAMGLGPQEAYLTVPKWYPSGAEPNDPWQAVARAIVLHLVAPEGRCNREVVKWAATARNADFVAVCELGTVPKVLEDLGLVRPLMSQL